MSSGQTLKTDLIHTEQSCWGQGRLPSRLPHQRTSTGASVVAAYCRWQHHSLVGADGEEHSTASEHKALAYTQDSFWLLNPIGEKTISCTRQITRTELQPTPGQSNHHTPPLTLQIHPVQKHWLKCTVHYSMIKHRQCKAALAVTQI